MHGDAFAGRRVAVTGGAGFIGSHLADALAGLDAQVVAVDDLSAGDWANIQDDRVRRVTASVLDRAAVDEALGGCELVFHEAAWGSVPKSLVDPEGYYRANVMGTIVVLEAARAAGVRRVVYAASSSAYGNPPDGDAPKVEAMTPAPLSPYAGSKLAGEHALAAYARCFDLDTVSLRYFNIFGPRQNANSDYAAVIAAFARALLADGEAVIFGDGEQSRDFTYIDNVVHANLLAGRCDRPLDGAVVNIACARRATINELFAKMAALTGQADRRAAYQPPRAGDVKHSLAAIDRARELIGYEPIVDFETGLAQTVAWYRRQMTAAAG